MVSGGCMFPKEQNIRIGLESNFGLALPLVKKMTIAFEFVYAKSPTKEEQDKLHNGTLTLTPFFVFVQYDLWGEKQLIPYLSLGVGYIFSRFKIGQYFSIPEIKINQKVKSGVGFELGLGVRLKLTQALSLLSEVNYFIRQASAETIISDMNLGVSSDIFSIDLNAILLEIGIKYFL